MRFILWAMLAAGLTVVAVWVAGFAIITVHMRPFGGIPYSWGLLRLNYGWVLLLLFGLALSGLALPLLLRRDTSES
jgi:hypothetical protein